MEYMECIPLLKRQSMQASLICPNPSKLLAPNPYTQTTKRYRVHNFHNTNYSQCILHTLFLWMLKVLMEPAGPTWDVNHACQGQDIRQDSQWNHEITVLIVSAIYHSVTVAVTVAVTVIPQVSSSVRKTKTNELQLLIFFVINLLGHPKWLF